jgi:hypothetical protein
MGKYFELQVPEGCSESWDAMTTRSGGRHCAACQKTVVDFTAMSDAELVRWFAGYKGEACGRLRADQLNRALIPPRKPLPWLRTFLTITLPALLFSQRSVAQGGILKATKTHNAAFSSTVPREPVRPLPPPVSIGACSGTVVDSLGKPVSWATVLVGSTRNGVAADEQGRFLLPEVPMPATITISAVGFLPQEITIKSSAPVQVTLPYDHRELAHFVLGGISVRSYSRRKTKKELRAETTRAAAEAALPSISAYPNPVVAGSALFVATRNLPPGPCRLELWNGQGQLLHSENSSIVKEGAPLRLETTGLSAGTFVLNIVHVGTGRHWSQQVVLRY